MTVEGCQGKRGITIEEKICPNCGAEVEIISIDTSAVCEKCGFTIYNDALNCVQWCKYARECVGETMYEQLMKVVENQKNRRMESA